MMKPSLYVILVSILVITVGVAVIQRAQAQAEQTKQANSCSWIYEKAKQAAIDGEQVLSATVLSADSLHSIAWSKLYDICRKEYLK